MSYHHLDADALDAAPDYPCDRRDLGAAADFGVLHVARYELAPGEDLARTYHEHAQREEGFHVLAGTLHVETPEGTVAVEAGETFLVEPGNPHRAHNPTEADAPVTVLGVGAPKTDPAIPHDG